MSKLDTYPIYNKKSWFSLSQSFSKMIREDNLPRYGKEFTKENNFIRRISTVGKKRLYCNIERVLLTVPTPDDMFEHVELLCRSSRCLQILIKRDITAKEVVELAKPLFEMRRDEKRLYPDDEVISINSHLAQHFPLNILRYGKYLLI